MYCKCYVFVLNVFFLWTLRRSATLWNRKKIRVTLRRVQKQALQVEIIYIIQTLFDLFSLNLVSNRYRPVIARKKCYCTDIRMISSCPYTTTNEHDKAAETMTYIKHQNTDMMVIYISIRWRAEVWTWLGVLIRWPVIFKTTNKQTETGFWQ